MINLSVCHSFAFDYLSILQIKYDNDRKNKRNRKEYKERLKEIKDQIKDFKEIYDSIEFQELHAANLAIFDAIEEIRNTKSKMTAKELDDTNSKRHVAKQKLQKRFFKNEFNEYKTPSNV